MGVYAKDAVSVCMVGQDLHNGPEAVGLLSKSRALYRPLCILIVYGRSRTLPVESYSYNYDQLPPSSLQSSFMDDLLQC